MSDEYEIHVDNIGTTFKCTILNGDGIENVSGATTKNIIFTRPDGTKMTKAASFYTDGSDGIITYTVVSGDLSVAGLWRIQGYVEYSASEQYYSNIKTFTVYGNL